MNKKAIFYLAIVFFLSGFVFAQTPSPAEAVALQQQGKYPEAADAWQAITKANPRDAAAFASLGVVLSKLEKYEDASTAYRRAIALDRKLPGMQLNLGLAE
ncbi:MAG TPA: tetratricopeptide repeat protein, partial [Terriglobales bacterium]|nr:tetratricopeptide repeat protein [Terriglobales bacterium]